MLTGQGLLALMQAASSATTPSTPPALVRPETNHPYTSKKSSRPKTSYQFAYPASHTHHKRWSLRSMLMMQVQQLSPTSRPLPVIDVLSSTICLPRLARTVPSHFQRKNALRPFDVIIETRELYERTGLGTPDKRPILEDDEKYQSEIVATICQMHQKDACLIDKAKICLCFGPVWEATFLPGGSYEFVAHTPDGIQVMRWALRGRKRHQDSGCERTQVRSDTKRFTFSVIDPNTRRHPVRASMSNNRLDIYEVSPAASRYSMEPATPSDNDSPASKMSEIGNTNNRDDMVILDNGLRTLIVVTGVWVAFQEGWSNRVHHDGPSSTPSVKCSISSTDSSNRNLATIIKGDNKNTIDIDEPNPNKEFAKNRHCRSIRSMRRAHSVTSRERTQWVGNLPIRPNSNCSSSKRQGSLLTASDVRNQPRNHGMFTRNGENVSGITVAFPSASRLITIQPGGSLQQASQPQNKSTCRRNDETPKLTVQGDRLADISLADPSNAASKDFGAEKRRRRHWFSSFFSVFRRKPGAL